MDGRTVILDKLNIEGFKKIDNHYILHLKQLDQTTLSVIKLGYGIKDLVTTILILGYK